MGIEIDREEFDATDYAKFRGCLRRNFEALQCLLQRSGFGEGETSIGCEIEFSLVDDAARALPLNRDVLADTLDPRVQLELDRFNLEYNARPVPIAGRPFTSLRCDVESAFGLMREVARQHGGRIALIGILPTLCWDDLQSSAMSDLRRFRALSAAVRRMRRTPFRIEIEGEDFLRTECDDVTLEGANTSFQLHVRVSPSAFARTYNAAQIAIAPALAIAGNSPIFLGRRLWEETRVALFRQAVDERADDDAWRPMRVSFGHGWVREGALELFAESVNLHEPLLPLTGSEDPLARARAGEVPALEELRLHQSTVWRWNRVVYDPTCGGHLRVEMRSLPAGPTVIDMLANAAFLVGLTFGLAPTTDSMLPALPFRYAHDNFYEAARRGLDATLFWPSDEPPSPRPIGARDLLPRLLPIVRRGLEQAGVDAGEAQSYLDVIAARAKVGLTGAQWQRRELSRLEARFGREKALESMLERYLSLSEEGKPVHSWPVS